MHKHAKYDSLINTICTKQRMENEPLITTTAGVRGAIHEQSINKLANLKIPKANIKNSLSIY
jgi:hypothetical protein